MSGKDEHDVSQTSPHLGDVATWMQLIQDDPGRALVRSIDDQLPADCIPTPAQLMRWRKKYDEQLVRCGVDVVRARRRHHGKYDLPTDALAIDTSGAEQATPWPIARYKAARFAEAMQTHPGLRVIDACCGTGADLIELARVCTVEKTIGIDADPVRAWMAQHNAMCPTQCKRAESVDAQGALVHLDPGRRTESTTGVRNRRWSLQQMQPSIDVVQHLLTQAHGGCVKLSPAADPDELLSHIEYSCAEYISMHGSLNQCAWWTDSLCNAPGHTRATGIDRETGRALFTITGQRQVHPTCIDKPDTYVFTIDSAVERAGLVGQLAANTSTTPMHQTTGLLTAASLPEPMHPALVPMRVCADMPWQQERVSRWLTDHDAGIVTVKVRQRVADADATATALRGKGETPYTLLLSHQPGRQPKCIIANRLTHS